MYTQNWLTASFCSPQAERNTVKKKNKTIASLQKIPATNSLSRTQLLKTEVSQLPRKKVRCFNISNCFILKPKYWTKEQTQEIKYPQIILTTLSSSISLDLFAYSSCLNELNLSSLCKCPLSQQPTGMSPTLACPHTPAQEPLNIWKRTAAALL